jgi:hypothetical protein
LVHGEQLTPAHWTMSLKRSNGVPSFVPGNVIELVPAPLVEQTHVSPLSMRACESFVKTHPDVVIVNVQLPRSLPEIEMKPAGNCARLFQQVLGTQPAPLSGTTSANVKPLRSNCAR